MGPGFTPEGYTAVDLGQTVSIYSKSEMACLLPDNLHEALFTNISRGIRFFLFKAQAISHDSDTTMK